jgi:hypothetical protein
MLEASLKRSASGFARDVNRGRGGRSGAEGKGFSGPSALIREEVGDGSGHRRREL